MPRKGPAFPTSKEWKEQVSAAIKALTKDPDSGITSDAAFARKAKISKSALSEALSDDPSRKQTPMMPDINAALGWPAPRVLSTPDELELWAAVQALEERELGRILGLAETKLATLRKRRT